LPTNQFNYFNVCAAGGTRWKKREDKNGSRVQKDREMDRVVEKSHTAQGNSEYLNSNSSWNYMMGRVEHEIGRDLGHKDYDTGKEDIGSGDIVVGALDLE